MSEHIAKLLKGQMASSVFYIILGLCLEAHACEDGRCHM